MHKSSPIYLLFVIAEACVLFMLLPPISMKWSTALIFHSLIAITVSIWISKKHHTKNKMSIVFVFGVVILFLPVLSIIILWLLEIKDDLKIRYDRKIKNENTVTDSQQIFDYIEDSKLSNNSNNIKNTHNLLSTLNDEDYLRLLIASRHLPDKAAYTLLQKALESPFESARLMAFSLKGKLEQRLQNTLQTNLALLKNLPERKQAEQHLILAKEYLHLLDIGIVSKDKRKLLQEATYHCIQSIKINNKSAHPYLILSKIFLYQGKIEKSSQAKKIAYSLQNG